jgi:hypothetical protein
MLEKIICANFQRIIEFLTQKIVNKLSKYGFGKQLKQRRYLSCGLPATRPTGEDQLPDLGGAVDGITGVCAL